MEEPTPSRALRGEAVLEDPLVRRLLGLRTVALLATVEPDGVPYVVPMWHAAGEGCVLLATGSRSRKVRNLTRDARAALTVHDSRAGYEVRGVWMAGRVELVRGNAARPLVEAVHRRFLRKAAEELPDAREFLDSDDVALRFVPERATTWDETGSTAAKAVRDAGAALPLETTASRREGEETLAASPPRLPPTPR